MREFSPAREEEVIVIQQVTDIYGRENRWDALSYHKKASNEGGKFILHSLAKQLWTGLSLSAMLRLFIILLTFERVDG